MDDPWFGLDEAMELLRARLASRRTRILLGDLPSSRTTRPAKCRPKPSEGDMGDVKLGELEEAKSKLRQAQDEIVKLQAVISDLTQVNKRWQRYNTDRQIYVQKLLTTIQDQQVQINKMGEEKAFPNRQNDNSEVCNRSECKILKEEVHKLKEKVELLEFQVKAHKDDWEAERNEKQQIMKDRDMIRMRHADALRELCAVKGYMNDSGNGRNNTMYNIYGQSDGPVSSYLPYHNSRATPAIMSSSILPDGELQCDGVLENYDRFSSIDSTVNGLAARPKNSLPKEKSTDSVTSRGSKGKDYDVDDIEENACALRPKEESYSQSSTVPMISSSKVSPCSSGASVHSCGSITQTVSMGFNNGLTTITALPPVVKSSSAPERRSAGFKKPPKCLNSISLTVLTPMPKTKLNIKPKEFSNDGVETQTKEDIKCLGCGAQFSPDNNIDFLDHFERCQNS